MGRVKCNYCGSYIDDSLTNCPHCGAVNESMVRFADKTPKTIEELSDWYFARNLPPEDITRFYIGKDVKTPRAFGIYEKNGKFIVYKNKSDGTRAIRYSGSDQAYAVNEIYMKLKEEILNQKNRNLMAGTRAAARSSGNSFQRTAGKAARGLFSGKLKRTIIIIIVLAILGSASEDETLSNRYYDGGSIDSIYYVDHRDNCEWWRFDDQTDDWTLDAEYSASSALPAGIDKADETTYDDLTRTYGTQIPECRSSRAYVDIHHPSISPGYYILNNSVYYYLNNSYGANSGWYAYNNGGWDYFCDEYDKDQLGEDLWYNTDSYYTTSDYSTLGPDSGYNYSDNENRATDFSDTEYYQTYQQDLSNYSSSSDYSSSTGSWNSYDDDDSWDWDWNSDSSWDWDSGSSWDSGWSDWDSDW